MKTRSSVYSLVLISWFRKAINFTEDLSLPLKHVLSRLVSRLGEYLTISIAWLKKAMHFVKELFLSLKCVASQSVVRNASRVKKWFEKNKQILAAVILITAIIYLIPYTFMLGDRGKTIVGIILQILAGVILVFEQISSNDRIKNKVTEMIRRPVVFALLGTAMLVPFAVSILTALGDVSPNKWLGAAGTALLTVLMFGMFLTSLALLRRIERLWRKGDVPVAKEKLDVSDLSPRNVGMLFGISLLIMILLIFSLRWIAPRNEPTLLMLWYVLFLLYGFTLFPLWILGPLYFAAFGVARLANYIRTNNSFEVWFWIFLFVLWAWGWLLLLLKELT
jgi:hypothetical protein